MALWPLVLLVVGGAGQADAPLPVGVRAEWSLAKAWRESTPTRGRVCLNGLWRWQPGTEGMPTGNWGWFKVPGCWPGITDYMQKDCQTVYANPNWSKTNLGQLTSAWYQREFTVPSDWSGRRIHLDADTVNSLATVYVDGSQVGSIAFPGGDVDLTKVAGPGSTHVLTIQVVALPLKAVMLSYSDTNAAKQMKATVERRGLCGDLYLVSSPPKARIDSVVVESSVRKWTLTVKADASGLDPMARYRLKARILDHGNLVGTMATDVFAGKDALSFTKPWRPKKLWDTNTPQNQYDLELTLTDAAGKVLDVQAPKKFGFRELWISGKDFMLNGSRIFWSCVPVDNAAISAGLSSYAGAKETLLRLKSFGINMVYTHNYDCKPGSNMAFEEILRAADDVGILVALTQPHFGDYEWSAPDADQKNGYARHAAYFAKVAGNHPSVIAYSTSHNATGYGEDMNPDQIDGIHANRDGWAQNNMKKALRAQAIIEKIDPSRIVYHHSSGNLGTMHTINFYLNFVPIQEMDDWYEHWSTVGVKPAFMVEYGVPFSWDWSLYRGWYKGQRSFGNAEVPWEYTMAEWNSQFLGDSAFNVSEGEKRNIRWEAQKFRSNSPGWFRWDYPNPMGSTNPDFEAQQEVWARYTTDNWRAFRTWGVSGISPWETYGLFWRLKSGVNRGRVDLATDWDRLQRPGYSPDYVDGRYERRDVAYEESDWVPTTGGKSLLANNGPLLAYIAGKPGKFTDKEHVFHAGQSFQKQLVVINNSRETVKCTCSWVFLPRNAEIGPETGPSVIHKFQLVAKTGEIRMTPLQFLLPAVPTEKEYAFRIAVKYSTGQTQTDQFIVRVLPTSPKVNPIAKLGIYDPAGETTKQLSALGVVGTSVKSSADLAGLKVLIVGKDALSPDGPGLDLSGVRDGLKVVMFEQSSEVLEKRFGFRVEEYGLRNVFRRVPGHPVLDGLDEDDLRDWHGDATIVPPRRSYVISDKWSNEPAIVRTGILQPRVWRCGNRGNVASVLIEKPTVGDFMPLLDGGFSLQYSPLMEYREGKGMVIFCQMDVTGRTESEPAADRLLANLLNYANTWKPSVQRTIAYWGEAAGRRHLESAGFKVEESARFTLDGSVMVFGPGADPQLSGLRESLQFNGQVIAIGLDEATASRLLTLRSNTRSLEYINSVFASAPAASVLAGIGPADVFNRDPRKLPVFDPSGAVLGASSDNRIVQFQMVPWSFDTEKINTKRTFRRTSFVLTRLLGNLGVHASTPLLERFNSPAQSGEQRWLKGFYLDTPVLEDDPYRFFGW